MFDLTLALAYFSTLASNPRARCAVTLARVIEGWVASERRRIQRRGRVSSSSSFVSSSARANLSLLLRFQRDLRARVCGRRRRARCKTVINHCRTARFCPLLPDTYRRVQRGTGFFKAARALLPAARFRMSRVHANIQKFRALFLTAANRLVAWNCKFIILPGFVALWVGSQRGASCFAIYKFFKRALSFQIDCHRWRSLMKNKIAITSVNYS